MANAFDQFDPTQAANPFDQFDESGAEQKKATALDYLKGAAAGSNQLASGVGFMLEKAGADRLGKSLREVGQEGEKYWHDSMTPAGRSAATNQVFEDDPNSIIPRFGPTPVQSALMGASESLPSTVAMAVPGAGIAGGLTRGAAGLAARGVGGATTAIAGGMASPVGVGSKIIAAAPSAIGMGASEGITSGAMNAAQSKAEIENASFDTLSKSPEFQSLRQSMGDEGVRAKLAEMAGNDVFGRTAASTGLIGILTGGGALGGAYRTATRGTKDGIIKGIAKEIGNEAFQETAQSGPEQLIQNLAKQDYLNPDQNPMEGVISGALSGGVTGGLMGGVMGGAGHLANRSSNVPVAEPSPAGMPVTPAGPLQRALDAGAQTVSVEMVPPIATAPPASVDASAIDVAQAAQQADASGEASPSPSGVTIAPPAVSAAPLTGLAGAASQLPITQNAPKENPKDTLAGLSDFSTSGLPSARQNPRKPEEYDQSTIDAAREMFGIGNEQNTPAAPEQLSSPVSTAAPSPKTSQAEPAGVPPSTTTGVSSNASPAQEAVSPTPRRKEEPAKVPASPEVTPGFPEEIAKFVSSRTDKQLATLASTGRPGYKELAVEEIARRSAMSPDSEKNTVGAESVNSSKSQGTVAKVVQSTTAPAVPNISADKPESEKAAPVQSPAKKSIDLSTRTDAQLAFLAKSNSQTVKNLADAEIARRSSADREWQDFVATEGRDIGPRRLAIARARFLRRKQLDAVKSASNMTPIAPAQPTSIAGKLEQTPAEMPIGEYGKRKEMSAGNVGDTLPAPKAARTATTISDDEYKAIADDARYLKDIVYSIANLVGDDKKTILRLSSRLGKSGRDTILMDALNIDRDLAHTINNRLDDKQPRSLRSQDMEDAFAKFPALRRIVEEAKQGSQPVAANETAPDAPQAPLSSADAPQGLRNGFESVAQRQVNAADKAHAAQGTKAQQEAAKDRKESPADALPAGWTEETPGGMATNRDKTTGGVVDKNLATGKWFFVSNREGVESKDGFDTRADAFAALSEANSAKLNYDEASTPKEAPDDSAYPGNSPSLDQPMAEGQRPDNPIRGAVTPRSRPRRPDDRGVRGAGRRADGSTDESKPLGDGGRSAAVSDGTDGVVAGGVRRVSADFRPGLGALTREGSWFDAAKRNIDLIELAIQIDKEKRNATTEEQAQLAKYVGFGASEIRNALFPIPGEYAKRLEPNRLVWPNLVRDARWKPLAERIDALPREWQKSILQSTQYAHYTSEGIIRSIWSAIQRLGFTGGNIFEPGTGIGSFSMLMPDGIHETSRFTGVEFDAPTALIARLLSPDQQIHHDDFIKRKFPKNYFDVNVGNPPFSQTKILGDAEYAKHGFMLHDFFFAKGIDLVRPGGLQVFVTSKGTMDKKTDRARKFLSDRADLIGAIRLPSTAFEGNAGTSVVTDVIFLKKRAPGEAPGGMAWGAIKTVDTKDGPVEVNEYFADHPEMILGQQRISGNTDDLGRRVNSNGYGGEKYTVVSYDSTPAELDAKFAEAVERLPENVYSPLRQSDEAVKAETRKVDFDPSVKREGVIYLDKDGAILRVSSGVGIPLDESVKLSDKDRSWLKGYVGIRDLVQSARLAQVTDGDWKAALRALNKAYDAFRAERGPILDFRTQVRKSTDEDGNIVETESRIFKNKRLYREDYDSALLTSLESISESGEIVKSPFLLGRTIGKPVVVEVKGIGDALAVSLDSIGSLDLADVGRRMGLSMEDTIEALGNQIYRTPAGQWQLADEFLSGDVVTKLEEAEHLARSNPDYRRNVEALKEVQPEKLGPSQISVKLGAAWVPVEHVNEFAKEIGAGHVTFDIKTETWQVEGGNRRTERKAGAEYGTTARSASELLEASLNSRSIKVTAVVDKKTVTDVEATTAANEMAKKIKDKFKRWVWTDSDRASELVEAYNKRFNNIAPRKFDGSHLTLPGVSLRFKLHPHQLRSIWRQIQTGDTYLAHAVGAGKTIEMIAGAMEQKRLGLIKKPMFVVPNHMLEQFSNEFMELYPLANIMVADDENFSAERRKAFVASATLNSPDAIIITHSAFKRIGVTEASVAPIRDEIVTDLEMELASLAKDQGTRVRRSQLEQQIEAVNQRFDAILGASGKDSTIKFEDIGADFIYADEAHAFRKLDFHTAQQIKGIDPNGSQAAMDMYVKTRILERARPGRAFVFASGTPVTNTMGELFTIMRFFAPQEMELSGISTFDSWARQFGEVAPALEPNAAGKYELIERFAKFDNVPELMSRVRQFMDVLTSESLGALVKRPNLAGGKPNLVVVEPTKALEAYMKGELSRRIEASKAWKPSPGQMSNPDPIVSIITDGRFAAIDPRFFGAELEGESIITKMASNVVAKYHATKENVYHDKEGNPAPIKGSTQIVFYNLGFGEQSQRSRGFNSRAAFTKLLTDGGIPRDEIAWFDDANTDAKKEAIFKDMRSGKLKVLIGSAKKMGTGVNVQNRLIALHYQDPPWFPADVEQPHGRIIRQGNLNQEVSIDWYTTKGTYQSTMWQMVGRKQRFIDQAFTGDKSLRSMDDMGEASLFEQAAAVASGDPRALQLAGLRQDVERFERLQAAHASEQISVRTALRSAEWDVEYETKRIGRFSKAFKAIGERYFQFDSGAVDGRTYSKTGEFGQALKDAFNRATRDRLMDMAGGDSVQLATIGSAIKITMEAQIDKNKPTGSFSMYVEIMGLQLHVVTAPSLGEETDATGLARKVFNQINSVDSSLRTQRANLATHEADIILLNKKLGAPFEYQQEMAEKYGELKRLEAELQGEVDKVAVPQSAGKKQGQEQDNPIQQAALSGALPGERQLARYDYQDVMARESGALPGESRFNQASSQAASPADRAVYDMAWDGKSSAEILSFISKASRRPFNRILARHLARIGVSSTITLDSQGGWSFGNTSQAQRYAASYNPRTDTVALFTPREAERHLLHELVHAATLKAIAKGGISAAQIKSLFNHIKKNGKLDGQYGMSNLDEFVAEAFSNPKFQDALKSVPAPADSIFKNAWEWFVRAVSNLIGMKTPAQRTALDHALTVGAKLMQENAELAGAAEENRYSLDGSQPFDGREVAKTPLKPGTTTLTVDGVERPALNSNGKPIHWSEEGVRNFWRWFGSSRVVDAQGSPLVVYHGTKGDFGVFKNVGGVVSTIFGKEKVDRQGFFFTDSPLIASEFAEQGARPTGSNVMPAYLSISSPLDFREGYFPDSILDQFEAAGISDHWLSRFSWGHLDGENGNIFVEEARRLGYDGVLFLEDDINEYDKFPVYVAFNPKQIKSATGNTGDFSPDNPDIRFNAGADWYNGPIGAPVRNLVANAMHSDKSTSWLTPFNTQYHKAEKWANEGKTRFKVVFGLVQRFLGDVSKFAIMAQNEAPTLLHEWRTLSDVRATLSSGDVLGKQHRADIAAIASPLYDGTLYGGGNPMSGIRWSDTQLRAKFKLSDRQIKLYREALAAVNVSMDELAKSIISRHAKMNKVNFDSGLPIKDMADGVIQRLDDVKKDLEALLDPSKKERIDGEIADLRDMDRNEEANKLQRDFEKSQRDAAKGIARIEKTIIDINGIVDKNTKLQDHGYFPLMRFGKHTVTAKDADGKVQFFGMYEGVPLMPRSGQYEANKVAAELRAAFPEWTVTTGIKNDEKYKLYQGLNIEAIQLFAEHMDQESLEPFQEFIRLATNNRSAQRRLLHRKGTPGFDKDVRRTLAQFMVSNSRATSSNYHMQDMLRAAADAEKDGGDIGAEAIKLVEYVRNPTEEAQALRGFLFFQFLGGSLASAAVNLTQTPAMTLPFLSKFEPAGKLTARLIAASKLAAGKPEAIQDEKLREALMRAEQDGVTAPQEIYQLTATAANNVFSGSRIASALLRGWGAPFSMAESFNRRIAFISAFQIAEKMGPDLFSKTGFKDSFVFAEDVVNQTQGIYNKGNRMNVGRGAAGSVLMTFKQYSIMYLELFKRLPPKQRAIMLGILILSAGGGGLPGVEDIEDLWDTIGQWLGFASNSKRTLRNTLTEWVGKDAADVAINGVLSRLGIDLHSRLGMQNLIPGTGILKQSSVDKGRDIEEFFGPAASVIKSLGDALESLATKHPDRAAMAIIPSAFRNLAQGSRMAVKGYSEDAKGRKGVPVSELESVAKMIGFNPKSVADYGAVKRDLAQDQRLINVKREEFSSAIADAILADDQEARAEALQSLRDWNAENPDARVSITASAIGKRVRDARAEGATRMLRSLPRGMRNQAREEFAQ